MTATEPRLKTGGKMHRIGTEAYAVVLEETGTLSGYREISERHPGHSWIAVTPGNGLTSQVDLLFVDDLGSAWSTFEITEDAHNARIGIYIDGELVNLLGASVVGLYRGSEIRVDWSGAFERMA